MPKEDSPDWRACLKRVGSLSIGCREDRLLLMLLESMMLKGESEGCKLCLLFPRRGETSLEKDVLC